MNSDTDDVRGFARRSNGHPTVCRCYECDLIESRTELHSLQDREALKDQIARIRQEPAEAICVCYRITSPLCQVPEHYAHFREPRVYEPEFDYSTLPEVDY